MFTTHPEFLTKDGQKIFAVLPYEEYCRMQELLDDYEDLVALRQAKAEEAMAPTYSLEEVKNMVGTSTNNG
jgi:hypothetical protein